MHGDGVNKRFLGTELFCQKLWRWIATSATRLGDFLKILGKKLSDKNSPNSLRIFGLFQANIFLCENLLWLLFWQILEMIWLLFITTSGRTDRNYLKKLF